MYLLIAKRIVLPWVFVSASLLSVLLYTIAEGFTLPKSAFAAELNQPVVNNPTDTTINQNSTKASFTSDCSISQRFPGTILQWCSLITHYALINNLNPNLIAALIWQESGGNPSAYSHSGAVGLMQIMPKDGLASGFQCPNGPCFENRPTIQELQDPEFNVSFGTKFLSDLINQKGNLREALKSYGPMDVGYSYAEKVINISENYGQ